MGLSTHILDTAIGRPAANVVLTLHKLRDGVWTELAGGTTDADGLCKTLLGNLPLEAASDELTFMTAPYFAAQQVVSLYPYVKNRPHRHRPDPALPHPRAAHRQRLHHVSRILTMPAKLRSNRYGKSRVRLMRLTKHAAQSGREAYHDLDEWTVQILLTGDFESAHTQGDNSKILPTDTMKNTVYFVARESKAESMEDYAKELIDYILTRNPQVTSAEVNIESTLWKRIHIDGKPFPTAFMRGSEERQTATVTRTQDGDQPGPFTIIAGLDHLTILKTSNSGFTGYIKDALTTLPETTDRLFGTALKAEWPYPPEAIARAAASPHQAIDFNKVRSHIREAMISTFAHHESKSVQQTLFAMAEAALAHTNILDEIYLLMPNKHNLLVDLSRFGQKNPNHIFVPTDEPHGTIEATVRRA